MLERCNELLHRLVPHGDEAVVCEAAPTSLRYVSQVQKNFVNSLQLIRKVRSRAEETEAAEAKANGEAVDGQGSSRESESGNGENGEATDELGEPPESAPGDNET
jgi:hypothetical protein